jgi:hypothetical protein
MQTLGLGGFWPSVFPPEHDGTSLRRRLNLMKTLGGRGAGRKYRFSLAFAKWPVLLPEVDGCEFLLFGSCNDDPFDLQVKLEPRSPAKPSRVVHIRNIPNDVTEAEIVHLGIPFGRVTNVLVLKGKNQVNDRMLNSWLCRRFNWIPDGAAGWRVVQLRVTRT